MAVSFHQLRPQMPPLTALGWDVCRPLHAHGPHAHPAAVASGCCVLAAAAAVTGTVVCRTLREQSMNFCTAGRHLSGSFGCSL